MAEEIKNLIEKIRHDGIQAARESSRKIEAEARDRAEAIIVQARREAEALVLDARREADTVRESGRHALRQAARDTLLALRESLLASLNKLVAAQVRQALAPQEMAALIHDALMKLSVQSDVVIIDLKPDDVEKIRAALLPRLNDELGKGITLKSSGTVAGGFTISFDAGRSHFDFSDEALAEYFVSALRPAVAAIIKT